MQKADSLLFNPLVRQKIISHKILVVLSRDLVASASCFFAQVRRQML